MKDFFNKDSSFENNDNNKAKIILLDTLISV